VFPQGATAAATAAPLAPPVAPPMHRGGSAAVEQAAGGAVAAGGGGGGGEGRAAQPRSPSPPSPQYTQQDATDHGPFGSYNPAPPSPHHRSPSPPPPLAPTGSAAVSAAAAGAAAAAAAGGSFSSRRRSLGDRTLAGGRLLRQLSTNSNAGGNAGPFSTDPLSPRAAAAAGGAPSGAAAASDGHSLRSPDYILSPTASAHLLSPRDSAGFHLQVHPLQLGHRREVHGQQAEVHGPLSSHSSYQQVRFLHWCYCTAVVALTLLRWYCCDKGVAIGMFTHLSSHHHPFITHH